MVWFLLGCSVCDLGTILFFHLSRIGSPVLSIMSLANFNGLLTSIILETCISVRQIAVSLALKITQGASLFSMI